MDHIKSIKRERGRVRQDELERIVRLRNVVDTDNLEAGLGITDRASSATAEQI